MNSHVGPAADGSVPPPATPAPTPVLPDLAQALLDAVVAISSDLDLRAVLGRLVESATELTGARYGGLGVVGADGSTLVDFVTRGVDRSMREALAVHLTSGHGVISATAEEPGVLRLDDLTAHPRFQGFPDQVPPMRTFLGAPIRIRGTLFGNLYLAEKAGGTTFTEQDELLVRGLGTAAGFVIENARAYGLSEQRRRWLEAWTDLSDALQPPIEYAEALLLLTRSVRTVSGAIAAAVVRPGEHGSSMVSADRSDRGRVDKVLDEVTRRGVGQDLVHVQVGDLEAVAVPLRVHLAAPAALVTIHDRPPLPGGPDDRELLTSFADQAALALDRVVAFAEREELAVTSDRERIARDLHDTVIQRLFATGLQLQGTAMIAGKPEVADRIERAVTDLDLTIRDIRGTIFELQHRHAGSLRSEIRSVVEEYVPLLGLRPVVRTTGPVDTVVTAAVRTRLVAALREAVSNVARHAHASSVEVEVAVADTELQLTVADDGDGVDAADTGASNEEAPPAQSGLVHARRHAQALGGTVELLPQDPAGARFVWRVPLA